MFGSLKFLSDKNGKPYSKLTLVFMDSLKKKISARMKKEKILKLFHAKIIFLKQVTYIYTMS